MKRLQGSRDRCHLDLERRPSVDQKPSVGRIVHYVSYGTPGGEYTAQCRAAVITDVHNLDPVPEHGVPYVDLCVLNPTGLFFNINCRYDNGITDAALAAPDAPSYKGGTWHWPERV
jgi:hypothetical protein